MARCSDAAEGADGEVCRCPRSGFDWWLAAGAQGRISAATTTAGRIPNGAIVEREVPVTAIEDGFLSLRLMRPDFSTAARMVDAINRRLGSDTATPVDAGAIRVRIPAGQERSLVTLVAQLEAIPVEPDMPARVIVNERTGTVVIGGHAVIAPVAVSHGSLVVEIAQEPVISQPSPLGEGETVVTHKEQTRVQEEEATVFPRPPG